MAKANPKAKKTSGPPTKGEDRLPWPVQPQLMSWFLFSRLDAVPPGELTPEMLEEWIELFNRMSTPDLSELHRYLHKEFEDFRKRFSNVDD